ncbi:hypothetical protein [Oceanicola sp. 502str15]|uniref:hypothetical protein n=1 Tax=Oceanicola sp. 502str15 TaxID=2696061 RepID=UPI002094B70C|nr:hypothetical protein [Oceanicola sp. 502str15]MCO6382250.1 hypothetical protein [Oceanicola sp. 502str15]
MRILPRNSEEFKNHSDALLSVAKIVALAAAAIWTLYQWDKSIFPKEDHERLLRAASLSPDITVTDSFFESFSIYDKPSARVRNMPTFTASILTLFNYYFSFLNNSDFPMSFSEGRVLLEGYQVRNEEDSEEWITLAEWSFEEAFGEWANTSRVIMPGGGLDLGGSRALNVEWCCKPSLIGRDLMLFRISIELNLATLDPTTALPASEQRKPKYVNQVTFLSGMDEPLGYSSSYVPLEDSSAPKASGSPPSQQSRSNSSLPNLKRPQSTKRIGSVQSKASKSAPKAATNDVGTQGTKKKITRKLRSGVFR